MSRRVVVRCVLPTLYGNEPEKLPRFSLQFLSSGRTFNATVSARNDKAAAEEGLIELAHQCPDFDPEGARLVSCIERP